jgi:hypothetical protein
VPSESRVRSVPELFTDVLAQITTLLRKEGQLARAEITENLGKMAVGLGFIVGAAVLLIPALVVLLQAAVMGIAAYGLAAGWAALIVGGVVLLLGIALLALGVRRLRTDAMIPRKTIHQFQRDVSFAKDQVRDQNDLHRAA